VNLKFISGTLILLAWAVCVQATEVTVPVKVTPVIPALPVDATVPHDDNFYTSSTKGPFYDQSLHELKARKLARGVANVTLCVAEIPNQMFQEAYKTSPVSGAVVGIWLGVKKGSARLAIGLWEIATFYHPGKNNYQPYIEPEVVFEEYLR